MSFEDKTQRTSYKQYYHPTVVIKNYVIIDGQLFFHQPVRNDLIKYDSIQKIATSQGDHYITGCLLDYNYFENYYSMVAKEEAKKAALDFLQGTVTVI